MRLLPFGFVLCGLLAGPACAQDIRWKPELAKPGDYVVIDQGGNGKYAHVFRGKVGKYYVIESYKGGKISGKSAFKTSLDRDGNYVKFVYADGATYRYQPHDCRRVVGTCSFTEISPDGTRRKQTHVAKATAEGFEFQIYDETGKLTDKGKMALDDRGNAGNGVIYGEGSKYTYKLVSSHFQ